MKTQPLVTIGIPTYNRPALLKNAINSVVKQNYLNLEVIIADNCTSGDEVDIVVESFKKKIKNLNYIKRDTNIGAVQNNLRIRNISSGKYFMWLADDDEITPNYIPSLVKILEDNHDASCAMGNYVQLISEKEKHFMRTSNYPEATPFNRAIRFVWRSDDSFYYGLHRTDIIKQATIPEYWSINKDSIEHNAYLLLMDVVLNGKVLLTKDSSVQWLQKHYTQKHYKQDKSFMEVIFKTVLLRINVHFIYWNKIRRSLGILAVVPIFFVSCVSLITEFALAFGGVAPGGSGESLLKKFLNRNKSNGVWFRDKRI